MAHRPVALLRAVGKAQESIPAVAVETGKFRGCSVLSSGASPRPGPLRSSLAPVPALRPDPVTSCGAFVQRARDCIDL